MEYYVSIRKQMLDLYSWNWLKKNYPRYIARIWYIVV